MNTALLSLPYKGISIALSALWCILKYMNSPGISNSDILDYMKDQRRTPYHSYYYQCCKVPWISVIRIAEKWDVGMFSRDEVIETAFLWLVASKVKSPTALGCARAAIC